MMMMKKNTLFPTTVEPASLLSQIPASTGKKSACGKQVDGCYDKKYLYNG
jgi:hypothetical protein